MTEEPFEEGLEYHEAHCRDCLVTILSPDRKVPRSASPNSVTRTFPPSEGGFKQMQRWVGGHISERFDTPCESVRQTAYYEDGQHKDV